MTDRLGEAVSARDFANVDREADGVLVDLAPPQGNCRVAGLEAELAVLRLRLHASEQAQAVLLGRCTQQRVLATELAHRLRNSLTLVQGMVRQTLRDSVSAAEARETLTARIVALGQAHGLLVEEHRKGASVARIVETALAPHAEAGGHRLRMAGPAVRLGPGQALALSMALHELATNAVKYGALSGESGRIEVAWRTSRAKGRRRFFLRWSEHDGPSVLPPTRRGLGSRLIERTLADSLGGEVVLQAEPAGMVCSMSAEMQPVR